MNAEAATDPFEVGKDICWLHGEHYRVATVLINDGERVKLSGMSKDYWRTKASLLPKMDKVPVNGSFTW